MEMGVVSVCRSDSFGVYDHIGCLSGWKLNNRIKRIIIMEAILVILIVVVMVFWACWSSYRTLTGKTGCGCSGGSCSSNDNCGDVLENNNKK